MTASLTVDVTVSAGDWTDLLPDAEAVAREAAAAAWRYAAGAGAGSAELSILLTDDDAVRRLNKQHRGQDRPTNVLSFPIGNAVPVDGLPTMLGDVVLASGVVAREAVSQAKPVAAHLRHLVVHGVLHLLGYDHQSDPDAERMESHEVAILVGLEVPNPYRYREAAK